MPDGQLCILATANAEIGAITAVTTIDVGEGPMDTTEARLHRWRNGERDLTIALLRCVAEMLSRHADDLPSVARNDHVVDRGGRGSTQPRPLRGLVQRRERG